MASRPLVVDVHSHILPERWIDMKEAGIIIHVLKCEGIGISRLDSARSHVRGPSDEVPVPAPQGANDEGLQEIP